MPHTEYDLCSAQRANQPEGVLCTQPAGWGTDHVGIGRCKRHGGSTPTHARGAQLELARRACDKLGIPIEVDPIEAILREVWESAGNVEFYRVLVQQLPTHPEPDEIVGTNEKGSPIYERGQAGIYGRPYHVSGIPTGEAKPNILVQLYNDERKHLVEVAATAVRLGIEKRRVDLEENRATEVFRAVTLALTAMGMESRFDEFREHFASALSIGRSVPASIGSPGAPVGANTTTLVGDSSD